MEGPPTTPPSRLTQQPATGRRRRRWIVAGAALALVILGFWALPRTLMTIGESELAGASCGDEDFVAAIGLLDAAGSFPLHAREAREIVADGVVSRCGEVWSRCLSVKHDAERRRADAYQAASVALSQRQEEELAAAPREPLEAALRARDELRRRHDDERLALLRSEWNDHDWTRHVPPAEREALCTSIAPALRWLGRAATDPTLCPCPLTP
ncbi:MAG: hypothetical protein IT374_02505 [Polyangiaceae bacterium]|nr:hypothetical protein [Polyangiaceae bacterium]